MAKQAKTIFPTNEIAHLWMHKAQAAAYNSSRNFYFEGDTIYSYGGHFPIARHVTQGKKSAILFTTRGYSVTTAKHIRDVRSSIPDATLVFNVPKMSAGCSHIYDHADNLAVFASEAKETLDKAKRSRTEGNSLLTQAFEYRETAKQYAKFFKIKFNAKDFAFLPKGIALDDLRIKAAERETRAVIARRKWDANRDARWQAKQARWQAKQAQWEEERRVNALKDAEKIELWRKGSTDVHPSYNWPTMLRIEGHEVVTSRGARVPVDHARKALSLVRKVVARGEEFITNGHTCHVGVYKVDRVTVDGTLYAGCHVIPLVEIEAIAPQLEA